MKPAVLTRDEARHRASTLLVEEYAVTLDLTADERTFPSRTRVRFTAEPGTSTFIDLVAVRVDDVVLNGLRLGADVVREGRIALPDLQERNELEVVAQCAYSRSGVGLHRFVDPVDGEVFCYTQFEPFDAHRVFACFDQPDLKAPFVLEVVAAPGHVVVSNGAVAERPDPGSGGRWSFATTPPISTYITAVVAGPYHVVEDRFDDVPLGLYCRRSLAQHLDPDEFFEITKQGLAWFPRIFGRPYPFTKYDQLLVPEFNFGAMENPGCVTFAERHVFRSKVTDAARLQRANTILHEMAHMWFGDLVTMRWWDDLWLNESFATYTAALAVAEATRFTDSWADVAHSLKAWAYRQDQLPTTHPITTDVPDTDTVINNFDGITYAKGASVLKQLVAWVGRDAFEQGVRDYFDAHAWGNAELRGFLEALERPSHRALRPWSAEWLERAGVNTLRLDAEVVDGRYRSATVTQTAPVEHPTLRGHRLVVGVYDEGEGGVLERRARLELDVVGERTEVKDLLDQPSGALLLLNDDDLTYAKVRFDAASTATLERSLSALPSALSRAICWGSLWDRTRDAEVPARRFVDLVVRHAAGEDDIGVLQTLLSQVRGAIDRYVDPPARTTADATLAGFARAQLEDAEPGGDHQLLWLRTLVATRAEPAFARAVLDGEVELPGLPVDPDLRWFVLANLAASGAASEGDIFAEESRDPTDIGRRGAAAARAALPHAEAKAAAWHEAFGQREETALATRRAILGAFWQVGQEDVLRPFALERWLDVLEPLWRERSTEEAVDLTHGAYPSSFVDEDVVAAADRALALDGIARPGLRVLVEARDGTLRALRARAADRGTVAP